MRVVARLTRPLRRRWECPVCGYTGAFDTASPPWGPRRYAICPSCGAQERHRLQRLVLEQIGVPHADWRVLHVSPEPFFTEYFGARAAGYETADLEQPDVDHQVDLRALPFADGTYDLVFASHVLVCIDDDEAAIREVRRVLRPGGAAILPVPIIQERTVEYGRPLEGGIVRAPGLDYFDRLRRHFGRVEVFTSADFPDRYQTYVHEDRSRWPTRTYPQRAPMAGRRHPDHVPVCWV